MKKLITLLLISVMCLSLAACGEKDGPDEEKDDAGKGGSEDVAAEPAVSGDSGEKEEKYTLTTEDGQVSIQVRTPEGFHAAEYMSEICLNFERAGQEEGASTQYAMSLMNEDEAAAVETMKQEVQYLLSANSGEEPREPEIQTVETDGRKWSYFSYSMDELEGYRVWTVLENGCVFACTAENVGNGLAPLDIDSIASELTECIVSD